MSTSDSSGAAKRRRSPILATVRALIRARITAGLITILPIVVSLWLLKLIFTSMRDASQWGVEAVLGTEWGQTIVLPRWQQEEQPDIIAEFGKLGIQALPENVQWGIAIFSVLLTAFLLYIIGMFAANIVGRRLLDLVERVVDRVPLVKTVYRSTKQIMSSFTGEQSQSFQRVALIPFPQERMRCVGFITTIFHDSVSGEELCTVFIPTTPNPTTGYLQILRRSDLVELDWSVEDAVRTIMSGGILRPEFLTIVPKGKRSAFESEQPAALAPPPSSPSVDE